MADLKKLGARLRGKRRRDREADRTAAMWIGAGCAAVAAGYLARAVVREAHGIDLEGKVVLVTGGSRGLGFHLAKELGSRGAKVAIVGRDSDAVERARDRLAAIGVKVYGVGCDVGDKAMADALIADVVERFGRIDVVVNNAGVIRVGPILDQTAADVDDVMRTNFRGAVHVTLASLAHLMKVGRDARIVNVTSIGGRIGVPHLASYSASKFALVGFSEALRAELDAMPNGPRVVTVVPGPMRTGSFENAQFQGRVGDEFDWFAASSSVPVLTIDAEVAARRIVGATIDGRAFLRVGASAYVGDWARRVSPALTTVAASLAARLLPRAAAAFERAPLDPARHGAPVIRGRDIESDLRGTPLMERGEIAALENNEEPRL